MRLGVVMLGLRLTQMWYGRKGGGGLMFKMKGAISVAHH